MKLYLAGLFIASFHWQGNLYRRLTEEEKKQRNSATYYLESYHYIHRQRYVDNIREDGIKIFLDSGAFSAFSKGIEVNIQAYCDYIKHNRDIIEEVDGCLLASVLDGIGSAEKTWRNQKYMMDQGINPLPCFHYGEDERYLEWYVKHFDYITLGGMVPISTPQLIKWLDRIWDNYLTDGSGRPKIRVHGFGLTSVTLMERYPWFSVDSSSWVQLARVGNMLLLPEGKNINVSERSPQSKIRGQHIDTLSPVEKRELEKYFESVGVDTERMRQTYLARWAYNIWAFDRLGKDHFKNDPKFERKTMELF